MQKNSFGYRKIYWYLKLVLGGVKHKPYQAKKINPEMDKSASHFNEEENVVVHTKCSSKYDSILKKK